MGRKLVVALLALILAVAASIAAYFMFFTGHRNEPVAVKIDCDKDVAAFAPSGGIWREYGVGGGSQGLLLRNGDYYSAGSFMIRYSSDDSRNLKIRLNEWAAQVGDRIVSLDVGTAEGRAWLRKASERELGELRTLSITEEVSGDNLVSLKRLAAFNPHVDVFIQTESDVTHLMAMFRSRAVIAINHNESLLKALSSQPQIEVLTLNASSPDSLALLPSLPKLRSLSIFTWDPGKAGDLPAGFPQLRSLLVVGSFEMSDMKAFKAAPAELEELSLLSDKLGDLSGLSRWKGLRTLVLLSGDISTLPELQKLSWAGIGPGSKLDKGSLSAFVAKHPKLAILDLMGNKSILDLGSLASLKELKGLVLSGSLENYDALHGMKSLRYIGISQEIWDEAPEQIAAIEKALPDAMVVRVKPICLGSGWILLILPLVLAAGLLRAGRRERVSGHGR